MIQLEDLAETAEELRKLGIDCCHSFVYGPHGGLEGLDVGEDFFPLWELSQPENWESLCRLDFVSIRARRGPDWSPDCHAVHRAMS
jgi:hypothetical protein